jgi:hypothetical protein
MTKLLSLVALSVALLGIAPTSHAVAEGCPEEGEGEKKQGKFHIEYINGKPVTVIDTVVSVCGKVPLKQDFMPLILSTVKKAPF